METRLLDPHLGALLLMMLVVAYVWLFVLGGQMLATAPTIFLFLQIVFCIGLITNGDFSDPFTFRWIAVVALGIFMFSVGVKLANRLSGFNPKRDTESYRELPLYDDLAGSGNAFILTTLVVVCVVVGYVFTSRIPDNAFLDSFARLLDAGRVDYSQFSRTRTGVTRDQYVAAGYAIQFTAILLPALICLLYIRGRINRWARPKLVAGALLAADLLFLTATGGRKYLVEVSVTFLVLFLGITSPLPSRLARRGPRSLIWLVAVLALFGSLTFLQGRLGSTENPIRATLTNLYDRTAGTFSEDQLRAIRILQDEAPVWGREWARTLRSAMPGPDTELTFDARVHGLLYGGSTRGSAPLNVWGSIYYNWGILGILFFPFLMGALLQRFTIRLLFRGGRSISQVTLIFLAGIRFSFWRDPYSLLLEGGVALILFLAFHRLLSRRRESAPRGRLVPKGATSDLTT